MLFLWNSYLFIPFLASYCVLASPGGNDRAGQMLEIDKTRPVKRNLLQLLLQWSSPEDSQGALGEYTETEYVPESSETPADALKDQKGGSSQEQTFKYEINETTEAMVAGEGQSASTNTFTGTPAITDMDLLMSSPATATSSLEWTSPATSQTVEKSLEKGAYIEDTSKDSHFLNTTSAPCGLSNDTEDFPPPPESFQLSLGLSQSLSLFIPLYSDWNSALATWGLAWEAHMYGLGSVFAITVFVSFVCLLGLPCRCPPGILYFALLHFFLLSFAGSQAFIFIYDAYSYQDRLPPLALVPLCALPYPCLLSAFSATFILLSLRSNLISLPLAISPFFSLLPKPCLLISFSILHFVLSLGCAGIFILVPIFLTGPLLIAQGVFVCHAIFLSFSYFVFYCLVQVDSKRVYRLDDNGESGESPKMVRLPKCPFAKMEDWERALQAGLVASVFLLSCGGLQLYAILHANGLGGYGHDFGFSAWPWWGFQTGCRLCEIGVCLGLALIGTHPVFCHKNPSIKSVIRSQSGSWSRLSPSRETDFAAERGVALSSQDSWGQAKSEKEEVAKEKLDTLPLCPTDGPGNGIEWDQKSNQISELGLPSNPSPSCKAKNAKETMLPPLNKLDSTVDLRPPSPINLSRSIDQALYSDSLFSHSIFEWPRLFQTSSSLSLNREGKFMDNSLFRTSSCKDIDQEMQPQRKQSPKQSDWKGSIDGSKQELCSKAKEVGKVRSHSWANRGHSFAQSSLPRAITHLSHYKRFRTLSMASQDSKGSGRLAGTKNLSESKQLEWDMAVQAEFVNVCKQIDALSVCSDTIDL